MNVSHCSLCGPSSIASISMEHHWLVTYAALYTGLEGPKGRTTAKTVVTSGEAAL